jgi:rhamnose utilization protein RhaD (predicted bifunctional aldolase and dehydrogenase)
MHPATNERQILDQLVAMSRALGEPARDYVILGEGNTSARVGEDRMWVKASGASLRGITADGFVQVRRDKVLELFEAGDIGDAEIEQGLRAAMLDSTLTRRPSVETLFHAYFLGVEGVKFVGHTHPTAVNAILCSRYGRDAVAGRIYPDEIVVCGVCPLFVDYVDPGVPLARAIRDQTQRYIAEQGRPPRSVLMQNHGVIALGSTPAQVEAITATWVKTARIISGTMAFGGPRFLSDRNVERICTRPDEHHRHRGITGAEQ